MKQEKTKQMGIITATLLLSASFASNATMVEVTGGSFSADITSGAFTGFYGADTNGLQGGTSILNDGTPQSGPGETAEFIINARSGVTNPSPDATGVRGRQNTSYSFDDTSTTLAELAASDSGLLGFTGAASFTGPIVAGDAFLDASTTGGMTWTNFQNTIDDFDLDIFTFGNMTLASIGSGGFELTGDLLLGGGLSFFIPGSAGDVVGSFSLITTTAPATVPVPAAVWFFGTGLLGLVGMKRKNARQV